MTAPITLSCFPPKDDKQSWLVNELVAFQILFYPFKIFYVFCVIIALILGVSNDGVNALSSTIFYADIDEFKQPEIGYQILFQAEKLIQNGSEIRV